MYGLMQKVQVDDIKNLLKLRLWIKLQKRLFVKSFKNLIYHIKVNKMSSDVNLQACALGAIFNFCCAAQGL